MKFYVAVFVLAGLLMVSCGKSDKKDYDPKALPKPKDYMDQISYMIGYDMGMGMMSDSLKPNADYLLQGLNMGLHGDSSLLNKKETEELRQKFQKTMIERQDARMKKENMELKEKAKTNKIESDRFLSQNKTKSGVITTASGLQYEVIKEGTGKKPQTDERVKIHVKASYLDGKEFDNTYTRQPAEVIVGKQVPGWVEALTNMKVGSIWKIYLPYQLGWGEGGMPPTIPPAAVLIFEMELVSIEGKAPKESQQAQPAR